VFFFCFFESSNPPALADTWNCLHKRNYLCFRLISFIS
jgi:hypothetical protein